MGQIEHIYYNVGDKLLLTDGSIVEVKRITKRRGETLMLIEFPDGKTINLVNDCNIDKKVQQSVLNDFPTKCFK